MTVVLKTANLSSDEKGRVWLSPIVGAITKIGDTSNQIQAIEHHGRVRILSPVERERIQGFDGQYTAGYSRHSRVGMTGDSVCVPLFRWVGERVSDTQV